MLVYGCFSLLVRLQSAVVDFLLLVMLMFGVCVLVDDRATGDRKSKLFLTPMRVHKILHCII